MAGYYHERLAEGTIDPLKAKAIVFHDGDTAAALVECDLIGNRCFVMRDGSVRTWQSLFNPEVV